MFRGIVIFESGKMGCHSGTASHVQTCETKSGAENLGTRLQLSPPPQFPGSPCDGGHRIGAAAQGVLLVNGGGMEHILLGWEGRRESQLHIITKVITKFPDNLQNLLLHLLTMAFYLWCQLLLAQQQ